MKTLRNVLKGVLAGCIAALIALLAIGTVLAYTNPLKHLSIPARPTQALTVNSSPDEVLALMLESDQTWDSLEAEYQLTNIDLTTGQTVTETQHFWLDKKGELARLEINGDNSTTFVRNTTSLNQENKNKKKYYQVELPGTFRYDGFNPRKWLLENPNAVYLHPFGKSLPTGYYDFLYPTGIAQSLITNQATGLESIKIVGEDQVAGRKTIIISRTPKNHLYWVDVETGIILRAQFIGDADHWQTQFDAQSIIYGKKIPASVFQFVPSKDAKSVTPSEFQDQ
ncbi:MAG: hypothetical protein HYX49_02795 [Chloroflexi bacterium]|nr:hypothetical protein [Chloroflexota bacterium]